MLLKLGGVLLPCSRARHVHQIQILDSCLQIPGTRRRTFRRCRIRRNQARFVIEMSFTDSTEKMILAESGRRKVLEKLLKKCGKTLNSILKQDTETEDVRIGELEDRVTEIYTAPGMPGFIRAENEWENAL